MKTPVVPVGNGCRFDIVGPFRRSKVVSTFQRVVSTFDLPKLFRRFDIVSTTFCIKSRLDVETARGLHSLDGVEGLLGAVTLRLLHLDGLRGRLRLHSVEVQLPREDLLEALRSLHELRVAEELHVAGDLWGKGVGEKKFSRG